MGQIYFIFHILIVIISLKLSAFIYVPHYFTSLNLFNIFPFFKDIFNPKEWTLGIVKTLKKLIMCFFTLYYVYLCIISISIYINHFY